MPETERGVYITSHHVQQEHLGLRQAAWAGQAAIEQRSEHRAYGRDRLVLHKVESHNLREIDGTSGRQAKSRDAPDMPRRIRP